MTKTFAGVGSRETPPDILKQMEVIGETLAKLRFTLRSGGAYGADSAFMKSYQQAKGKMEIFLPWESYNGWNLSLKDDQYAYGCSYDAIQIAEMFHPAWNRCTEGARKLHGRNVHIIGGATLDKPVDFIVCWTKDGTAIGGTGLAMRIAEHFKIKVFNLYFNHTTEELEEYVQDAIAV